jgi:molecular chaperone GrpE (heat shock protein)
MTEDAEGGVSPESRAAYAKAARDFERAVGPLGLRVIRPQGGDEFDDRVHEADGVEESAAVAPDRVVRCTAWGFQHAGGIERAKVVLAAKASTDTAARAVDATTSPAA